MVIAQKIRTEVAPAELAAALDDRRSSQGWVARCPAHHDRGPSISIAESFHGGLVSRCFAGCSWSEIRDALAARSLWPEPRTRTDAHRTYCRRARDPLHAVAEAGFVGRPPNDLDRRQ